MRSALGIFGFLVIVFILWGELAYDDAPLYKGPWHDNHGSGFTFALYPKQKECK